MGYLQVGGILTEDEPTNLIGVMLESLSGSYSPVGIQFTVDASLDDATVEVATQIQESALEATYGAELPPCPGHKHPAVAISIDGVPKWVCLQEGAAYYAAEILPRFDPRSTIEEYMELNPSSTSPG